MTLTRQGQCATPLRGAGAVAPALSEAGFQHIRTYGDFQETYQEDDPDFFIHVASKSYDLEHGPRDLKKIASVAETYYDSGDADNFY